MPETPREALDAAEAAIRAELSSSREVEPDALARAALEEIKARAFSAQCAPSITRDWARGKSADDVPRLVAALEAVLKLADGWAREGEGPIWRLDDDEAGARRAGNEHAAALREAITRTLTGDTDA